MGTLNNATHSVLRIAGPLFLCLGIAFGAVFSYSEGHKAGKREGACKMAYAVTETVLNDASETMHLAWGRTLGGCAADGFKMDADK